MADQCSEDHLVMGVQVALPTGLGKTLIAAVVMYNFSRWFPKACMCCHASMSSCCAAMSIIAIVDLSVSYQYAACSTTCAIDCCRARSCFVHPQSRCSTSRSQHAMKR